MKAWLGPGSLSISSALGLRQLVSTTQAFIVSLTLKRSWLEHALLSFLDSKIGSFYIYSWFIPWQVIMCLWHSTLAMLTNFPPSRQKWIWCLGWSRRTIWMLFYGQCFSGLDKTNISVTDKLTHHRVIRSRQHIMGKLVILNHAASNAAWNKGSKGIQKMLCIA